MSMENVKKNSTAVRLLAQKLLAYFNLSHILDYRACKYRQRQKKNAATKIATIANCLAG